MEGERDRLGQSLTPTEIVRAMPLDDPIIPHEPLPGTQPTDVIVSQGRDED